MTTPSKERQEWLDFAHTVDVLTSSALARSDLAQTPGPAAPERAARVAGAAAAASPSFARRRRALGGVLIAACLLLVAVPVARLLDPDRFGGSERQSGDGARPIALQIVLAKTSYQPGEPLSFKLQSDKDCHPLVYSIGADNQVRLFDPTPAGAGAGDASLKANDPIQVPARDPRGAPPTAASPGSYTIGALCSREGLAALGTSESVLREKAQEGGASFQSYLSGLADRDQLGVATTTYDVK